MLLKKRTKSKLVPKKAGITFFRPQIRSQHPSHEHLRGSLNRVNKRVVVRLGSTTTLQEIYAKKNLTPFQFEKIVEINSVQSIKNSASKLLMKRCFSANNVKTADWWTVDNNHINFYKSGQPAAAGTTPNTSGNLPYPIVSKHIYGSRGTGNQLHNNQQELEQWMRGKDLNNYIFEKFYNYNREYRLHVTKEGCFYTCRKMLKEGTPEANRWYRNDTNSAWILEENPEFDGPVNWNEIVAECVKALNAVGLDIGGFDVKVQSRLDSRNRARQNPEFIIIESNSACSHGDITAVKYREQLNRVIASKLNGGNNRN